MKLFSLNVKNQVTDINIILLRMATMTLGHIWTGTRPRSTPRQTMIDLGKQKVSRFFSAFNYRRFIESIKKPWLDEQCRNVLANNFNVQKMIIGKLALLLVLCAYCEYLLQ